MPSRRVNCGDADGFHRLLAVGRRTSLGHETSTRFVLTPICSLTVFRSHRFPRRLQSHDKSHQTERNAGHRRRTLQATCHIGKRVFDGHPLQERDFVHQVQERLLRPIAEQAAVQGHGMKNPSKETTQQSPRLGHVSVSSWDSTLSE